MANSIQIQNMKQVIEGLQLSMHGNVGQLQKGGSLIEDKIDDIMVQFERIRQDTAGRITLDKDLEERVKALEKRLYN